MKKLIFLFTAILLAAHTHAATETYTERIEGASITTGATFTVYDDNYTLMATTPTWPSLFTNRKVTNRVILGINPEVVQTSTYTGGITVTITSWTWNSTTGVFDMSSTSKSLGVSYSTTGTNEVTDLSAYVSADAHRIEVEVTGIDAGISVSDLFIQSEIEVERYYSFGGAAPTGISGTVSGENIDFEWSQVTGAEQYELEWVHINNYKASDLTLSIPDNQLSYDFYRNSTRVIVSTPYYSVPKLLDRGRVVFRVRAIGLTGQDYTMRQEGTWSAPESGLVSTHPAAQVVAISAELEPGMNWGHQVAYTEDGKRFDGISYMDGMGRTRQSAGKNTVTGQAIVSNVYMDGYGRPVITDLPTPADDGSMLFRADFNIVDGGTDFGASQIDQTSIMDSPTCSFEIPGFSTTAGAGMYYSPSNPDQEGANARIPDAQKYPFTKIEYKDDFTGRVERSGAFGADFTVGSGHTTYISYVTPTQEELDRLFGSEVGYQEHYQQRYTIDANGQAYIEYFDMAGRLVASGMAGGSPDALDDIDGSLFSEDIRTITQGVNGDVTPVSMSYTSTLLVTTEADYVFDYALEPVQYKDECMPVDLCLDCAYTLTIRIRDQDCGTIVREEELHINGEAYDAICNGTYPYEMPSITQALTPKLYVVEKVLSIDQDAIDAYWCDYIENSSCTEPYSTIFDDLYTAADFDDCQDNGYVAPGSPDECEVGKALMLTDLSPGGQYGGYINTSGVYTSTDPISVFTESGSSLSGNWRSPAGGYEDANGSPAVVEVTEISPGVYSPAVVTGATVTGPLPNGNYTIAPEDLDDLTDFIHRFQPSWAEALLPYHPEYCYLEFCEDNAASHDYDAEMETITTFDEACAGGYFAPLGTISSITSVYSGCNTTLAPDPFFDTGSGSAVSTAMTNAMNHYWIEGATFMSLWDYAISSVVCPDAKTIADMKACAQAYRDDCDKDAIWLRFRELYLELKESYYYQVEEDSTAACNNAAIGNGAGGNPFADARKDWGLYTDAANGNITTTPSADFDDMIADVCAQSCAIYADEWIQSLSGCPGYALLTTSEKADMRSDFIALCSYGCDEDHPQGATTMPSSGTLVLPSGIGTLTDEDGINEILALYYSGFSESTTCTELLVSEPRPYDDDPVNPESLLDTCGCNILLQARYEFEALGEDLPAGVTTLADYLAWSQGLQIDAVNMLLCKCDQALGETEWSPGYVWTSTESDDLFKEEAVVAPELTCSSCVDCKTISALTERLDLRLTDVAESQNYPVILTNFLNNTLGFHLGYSYYEAFILHCNGGKDPAICEPTDELLSWFDVTNLIVHRGQLVTDEEDAVDLVTENVVYPNSDLQTALGATHYWSETAGNTLTIHYSDGSELACTVELTLPEDGAFGFGDVVSFDDIELVNPGCDSKEFLLHVHYISCGALVAGELTGTSNCFPIMNCFCGFDGQLCDLTPAEQYADETPCYEPLLSQLYEETRQLYEDEIAAAYTEFAANYNDKCSDAFASELFEVTGPLDIYQFTLYYYDQAGNLVKTVAPKGVDVLASTSAVVTSRDNTTGIDNQAAAVVPAHTYTTEYAYNSYDQPVSTTNPDQEGATQFWYDRYGRIVLSRNPVQEDADLMSYTLYDPQGRPMEVGQVEAHSPPPESTALKVDDRGAAFQSWIFGRARHEVTYSHYDTPMSSTVSAGFAAGSQQNLRLRVASIVYFDDIAANSDTMPVTGYVSAIHYSYDLHGNVIESLQDVPQMALAGQSIKSTQYDFELISGNVKKVRYQQGERDQQIHSYKYDQLNRLTEVFTSTDDVFYQRDARYLYYDYGPLARVETGQYKVQGSDYAYTINGWMKGVNSNTLDAARDGGTDGTTGYSTTNPNVHLDFAKDVYGYTLGYYDGDYRSIATTGFEAAVFGTPNDLGDAVSGLYNGNIAWSTLAIEGFEHQAGVYRYDQLQRLKSMRVFRAADLVTDNDWSSAAETDEYASAYAYDANGNITHLTRNGTTALGLAMDDLTYQYYTGDWNRLELVTDAGLTGTTYDDVRTMYSPNYQYDKLGQLTSDFQENQDITWRYGDKRIKTTTTGLLSGNNIEFVYNPLGQRVLKIVKPSSGGSPLPDSMWVYEYYAYDANGQVMATYEVKMATYNTAKLNEQMIYGAGRIGYKDRDALIYTDGGVLPNPHGIFENTLGQKRYELTNHLGNVVAVISDRNLASMGSTLYEAVVLTKSDYYPFGMPMPGRNVNLSDYRYGYNGMEMDNEMKGNGNSYTTEFRQYDPRLGRWLSLDPLMGQFPWMSPYVGFDDNPVVFTDPYGLESEGGGDPIIKTAKKALTLGVKIASNTLDEFICMPDESQRSSIGKLKNGASGLSMSLTGSSSSSIPLKIVTEYEEYIQEASKHTLAYLGGTINSYVSNNLLGAGRQDAHVWGSYADTYHSGQVVGDYLSMFSGVLEIVNGAELFGGGFVAEGTGVLAVPGAAGQLVGSAEMAHGTTVISTATAARANDDYESTVSSNQNNMSSGNGSGSGSRNGKSINQLNKDVKTGNAPSTIKRFDKGKIKGEKDHVHFDDGSALNVDGTWKHGNKNLTKSEKKYLKANGWKI